VGFLSFDLLLSLDFLLELLDLAHQVLKADYSTAAALQFLDEDGLAVHLGKSDVAGRCLSGEEIDSQRGSITTLIDLADVLDTADVEGNVGSLVGDKHSLTSMIDANLSLLGIAWHLFRLAVAVKLIELK
jgi:hypothetical protein